MLLWDEYSDSLANDLKATVIGSVLFSSLPLESAEFYDHVRGLEYDGDLDYDCWQGIFNDLVEAQVHIL